MMPLQSPVTRLPDWPARLHAVVVVRLQLPFAWGVNDCALWVADAVAAMLGRDALAELRQPVRRTAAQAYRAVRRRGGYAAALARAGLQPVPPACAQRGDVALLPAPGQPTPALAICMGADAAAPGPHGLVTMPMAQATAAWRV
jgi:hypothetical protein